MTYLGRGHSKVFIGLDTVVKHVSSPWEPCYMAEHPETFVPIIHIGANQFQMPRLEEPEVPSDMPLALFDGLAQLQRLWTFSRKNPNVQWRELLHGHLHTVGQKYAISDAFIDRVVGDLPEVKHERRIHGDPSLANILFSPRTNRWLWIDPLDRPYIPGDPHVDLGKMLQSCLGYEQVLVGQTPRYDERLARALVRHAGLQFDVAMTWALIHYIRLLPYQEPAHQAIFLEMLHDHGV